MAPWIVVNDRKLVTSGSDGERSYGINGRDFAYRLFREDSGGVRKGKAWMLTDGDKRLATLTDRAIHSEVDLPVGAAILGFTLIRYGIPGEAKLVPANWA